MPNGNTTPSESTSPDAISDKIQYYVIKKYDKKEEARLKKIDNDEDLKNEFKQDLRARLQQGKLDDVRFISPSKDEAFQNRATRILRDALFEIDLEMQSEEWNKDPRNVITNEDSANNIAKGADPIRAFSAEILFIQMRIFLYQGAGMDFIFKRTHSHQSVYRGPLGEKWDHNYNLRLIVTNDHNLIYRSNGNGTQTLYRRHNFHNYWLTEKGEDGVINESANGFIWHSNNGVEFYYESQFNSNARCFLN